jgi:hypothetical protein
MASLYSRGVPIFQKSRSHLKILDARRLTLIKFHTEAPNDIWRHRRKFGRHGDLYFLTAAIELYSLLVFVCNMLED